jgi:hypothetical protein
VRGNISISFSSLFAFWLCIEIVLKTHHYLVTYDEDAFCLKERMDEIKRKRRIMRKRSHENNHRDERGFGYKETTLVQINQNLGDMVKTNNLDKSY